jgi:hypothetical protein
MEAQNNADSLRELNCSKAYWIGLKALDKNDGLVFENFSGGNMRLDEKELKKLFGKYLGPAGKFKKEQEQGDWEFEL